MDSKKQQQVEMVAIGAIRTEGLQMRAVRSEEAALEYADKYQAGVELPPGNAVRDAEGVYWLWDGHHRLEGRKLAKLDTMPLVVTEGTREDAEWLALSANRAHGLRRTNADKRRAVEMAVRHRRAMGPDGKSPMSSALLAEWCGVSDFLVRDVRSSLRDSRSESESTTRTDRNGRVIDVSNIGKSRQEDTADEPDRCSQSGCTNPVLPDKTTCQPCEEALDARTRASFADTKPEGCAQPGCTNAALPGGKFYCQPCEDAQEERTRKTLAYNPPDEPATQHTPQASQPEPAPSPPSAGLGSSGGGGDPVDDEKGYACPECDAIMPYEGWHCPNCGGHTPPENDRCKCCGLAECSQPGCHNMAFPGSYCQGCREHLDHVGPHIDAGGDAPGSNLPPLLIDSMNTDEPDAAEADEDTALQAEEAEWLAQQEAAAQEQEKPEEPSPETVDLPQGPVLKWLAQQDAQPESVEPDAEEEPQVEEEPPTPQPKHTQHGRLADDRLRDQAGHIVPENLVEAFEARDDFARLASLLRECQKMVHSIATSAGGELYQRRLTCKRKKPGQPLQFSCESIATAIRSALGSMPYAAICPYCKDRVKHDCKICTGMGFVGERHWEEAPSDYKEVCTRILQERAAKEARREAS